MLNIFIEQKIDFQSEKIDLTPGVAITHFSIKIVNWLPLLADIIQWIEIIAGKEQNLHMT